MATKALKSVDAVHNGHPVRGIYRCELGTFEAKKGVVKIRVPEYEYWFDFTVAGNRYRSVFGRESSFGKIGASGRWESHAIEEAVKTLLKFKENAKSGEGPTSIKEELGLSRKVAEENRRKEKRQKTIVELTDLFLEDISITKPGIKANKPRTVKEYRQNLYRDVIPHIGDRKAKDIEREDISEVIEKIVAKGKIVQANRTLAACSRLFNWALSKGRVRYNPCAMMAKYDEKPRERVLTELEKKEKTSSPATHDEIKTLWEALNDVGHQVEARVLLTCILTGARPGEICNMRWEDIDDDNWWTVHQDEIKTEVELECFITPSTMKILGCRKDSGYVFALITDSSRPLPVARLSKYVREVHGHFGLQPWQPRDLRRTFTTLAKGFGFSDLIVNKAQARRDRSVIREHYDKRKYYVEMRNLFEAVEREILRITGMKSKSTKILQFKS